MYHLRNLINRRSVVKKPEKNVSACEEFFLLVVEAHICAAVMKVFEMSSVNDTPTESLFPPGCSELNSKQRWNIMKLAVRKVIEEFVVVNYPTAAKKDDDHVRAYAKEVLSLGLLLMEFVDSVREACGERIFRCWRYFLPLFKCSDRTNYSVEAFNLLFEYEYALTPRMKQQMMWERTVNVHGKQGRNVSMDLHMEHINKECKQAMGSLGSNIGEKAVGRIGRSIGEVMKVTQNFDSVNKVREESGHHPRRTVQLDMEKLLAQLQDDDVYGHVRGRKHSKFKKIQANMTRKLLVSTLSKWMKEQVHKYKTVYI